ncbi:MAG: hypothetical protein AVDCRST_MAG65-2346, partial [uncultured Solirubrobacteraceae bacterium]
EGHTDTDKGKGRDVDLRTPSAPGQPAHRARLRRSRRARSQRRLHARPRARIRSLHPRLRRRGGHRDRQLPRPAVRPAAGM